MSSVPYLPLYLPEGPRYRCPGESYDISYSVHLARMAASFPDCRNCRHRSETGEFAEGVLNWLDRPEEQNAGGLQFTEDGIRGVYLNDLNRHSVGQLAGAFARLLWERHPPQVKPRTSQSESNKAEDNASINLQGPLVLVGHDERPHSADLQQGAVQVLRRMSCRVLDAGTVPVPWFERLMTTYQTTAAIYVGASGESPAWSGMRFWEGTGIPCTSDSLLPEIELMYQSGLQRPSRSSSGYQSVRNVAQFEVGLQYLFHALRPLKIVVGSASRHAEDVLRRLLSTTACELIFENLPRRKTNWKQENDPDRKTLTSVIHEREAHLGCLIGEDWQEMICVDETGREVPYLAAALFAVDELLIEDRGAGIAVAEGVAGELEAALKQRRVGMIRTTGSRPALVRGIHEGGARLGIGIDRLWFQDGGTTCDGLMWLGMILQAMSRSDLELSQLAAQVQISGASVRV